MLQSEYDARFFDQVYRDVTPTEEWIMEDHAFNYVWADAGLMS